MGFKDICPGVPSKFLSGTPNVPEIFKAQKRCMSGNAYEQFDFPAVGENIHRRRPSIIQPLTGWNK